MTKVEISRLVSIIYAHHNAPASEQQVELFSLEIMPNATLSEALEAVRRYYARSTSGRWCTAGDVNSGIRQIRRETYPSELDIARQLDQLNLPPMQAWEARRRIIASVVEGLPLPAATRKAVAELQSAPTDESKHTSKTHIKGSPTGEHPAPYHLLGSPFKHLRKEP